MQCGGEGMAEPTVHAAPFSPLLDPGPEAKIPKRQPSAMPNIDPGTGEEGKSQKKVITPDVFEDVFSR